MKIRQSLKVVPRFLLNGPRRVDLLFGKNPSLKARWSASIDLALEHGCLNLL